MGEQRTLSLALAEYYQSLRQKYKRQLEALSTAVESKKLFLHPPRLQKYLRYQKVVIITYLLITILCALFAVNRNELSSFLNAAIFYLNRFSSAFLFLLLLGVAIFKKENIQTLYLISFLSIGIIVVFLFPVVQRQQIFLYTALLGCLISFILYFCCLKLLHNGYLEFKDNVKKMAKTISENQNNGELNIFNADAESHRFTGKFLISLLATSFLSFVVILSSLNLETYDVRFVIIVYIILISYFIIRRDDSVLLGYFLVSFSSAYKLRLLYDQKVLLSNKGENVGLFSKSYLFNQHAETQEQETKQHLFSLKSQQVYSTWSQQELFLKSQEKSIEEEKWKREFLEKERTNDLRLEIEQLKQLRIQIQRHLGSLAIEQLNNLHELLKDIKTPDSPTPRDINKSIKLNEFNDVVKDIVCYINKIGTDDIKRIVDLEVKSRKIISDKMES